MKTINSKLQKAEMKSLTIVAAIFAAVFTLNAQGAKFENSAMNENSLALKNNSNAMNTATVKTENTAAAGAYANFLIEESDEALEMEDWMVNESKFYFHLETEMEIPMELESWMTDATYFGAAALLETETEETLNVENWMLNDSLFNAPEAEKTAAKQESAPKSKNVSSGATYQGTKFGRRVFILVEEEDPKLNLEQWMVDYRHWNIK